MEPGAVPHPTVLVIDDDPDFRGLLADVLRERGYTVATAHDGASGLVLLHTIAVNLILLDLEMPGMSGIEFLSLWNSDARSGAPIVLMSGATRIDIPPASYATQLPKPFPLQGLLEVVARFVVAQPGRT
jgi:DNA-binding response OmpR family regulator